MRKWRISGALPAGLAGPSGCRTTGKVRPRKKLGIYAESCAWERVPCLLKLVYRVHRVQVREENMGMQEFLSDLPLRAHIQTLSEEFIP